MNKNTAVSDAPEIITQVTCRLSNKICQELLFDELLRKAIARQIHP